MFTRIVVLPLVVFLFSACKAPPFADTSVREAEDVAEPEKVDSFEFPEPGPGATDEAKVTEVLGCTLTSEDPRLANTPHFAKVVAAFEETITSLRKVPFAFSPNLDLSAVNACDDSILESAEASYAAKTSSQLTIRENAVELKIPILEKSAVEGEAGCGGQEGCDPASPAPEAFKDADRPYLRIFVLYPK